MFFGVSWLMRALLYVSFRLDVEVPEVSALPESSAHLVHLLSPHLLDRRRAFRAFDSRGEPLAIDEGAFELPVADPLDVRGLAAQVGLCGVDELFSIRLTPVEATRQLLPSVLVLAP